MGIVGFESWLACSAWFGKVLEGFGQSGRSNVEYDFHMWVHVHLKVSVLECVLGLVRRHAIDLGPRQCYCSTERVLPFLEHVEWENSLSVKLGASWKVKYPFDVLALLRVLPYRYSLLLVALVICVIVSSAQLKSIFDQATLQACMQRL